MAKIKFGTDGWRAIIAEDYTFDNVRICAQATATTMRERGVADRGLVVGYDTRFLSEDFAAATAEVAAANGIHVYLCDRAAPTPTVSWAILDQKAGGAVMITSSHNPASWNGFKIKSEYGGSAPKDQIAIVERHIAAIQAGREQVRSIKLEQALREGKVTMLNPQPAYLKQVASLVDMDAIKGAGITVAIDAMFGAGIGYFPALLAGGNTRIIEVNNVRNPVFPGMHNPEPIERNLAALAAAIKGYGTAAGIANDGDADRVGLMDQNGQFINQLQVFGLLLLYLLEVKGQRGPIVKTITTTAMARKLGEKYNVPVYETAVGFPYVAPKMLETGAMIGGEESGGFGFAGHIPERDGVLAGLALLDLMIKTKKSPSELIDHLYSLVGPHYYDRIDMRLPEDQREAILERVRASKPEEVAGIKVTSIDTMDGFRYCLEDGGWMLVRFSGTEPLVRIYTETTHKDKVADILAAGKKLTGM